MALLISIPLVLLVSIQYHLLLSTKQHTWLSSSEVSLMLGDWNCWNTGQTCLVCLRLAMMTDTVLVTVQALHVHTVHTTSQQQKHLI